MKEGAGVSFRLSCCDRSHTDVVCSNLSWAPLPCLPFERFSLENQHTVPARDLDGNQILGNQHANGMAKTLSNLEVQWGGGR